MTHTRPYDNDTPQAERRQIVKNDSYFSRQQNAVDDAGGRFAKLTPSDLTGSTSSPQAPKLPASSPWAKGFDEVVGVEPALGIRVDDLGGSDAAPNDAVLSSSVETDEPPKPMEQK